MQDYDCIRKMTRKIHENREYSSCAFNLTGYNTAENKVRHNGPRMAAASIFIKNSRLRFRFELEEDGMALAFLVDNHREEDRENEDHKGEDNNGNDQRDVEAVLTIGQGLLEARRTHRNLLAEQDGARGNDAAAIDSGRN